MSSLDKILVIDLEATCWRGYPPRGMKQEIIEIGACLLDVKTGEITDKTSYLIKPILSEVSKFCTELTSITQAMVDEKGITYEQACEKMKEDLKSHKRVWGSWGNWDKTMFWRNSKNLRTNNPVSDDHINIKTLFSLRKKFRKGMGLGKAVIEVGLEFKGTHHRGDDDAWMAAHVLKEVI